MLVERDAAAAPRERAELIRRRRRVRRVVRIAAAVERRGDVRPRFLAAVGDVVDERVHHPVVAADVDHRRARCLVRLVRRIAGIGRAARPGVEERRARRADRDRAEYTMSPRMWARVRKLVASIPSFDLSPRRKLSTDCADGGGDTAAHPLVSEGLLRGGKAGEAERDRRPRRIVHRHDSPLRVPAVDRAVDSRLRVELRRGRPQRRVQRIPVDVDGKHAGRDVDRVLLDVAPYARFVARLVRVLVGHAQLRSAESHAGARFPTGR